MFYAIAKGISVIPCAPIDIFSFPLSRARTDKPTQSHAKNSSLKMEKRQVHKKFPLFFDFLQ